MPDWSTLAQAADNATDNQLAADVVVGAAQASDTPADAAQNAQATGQLQESTQAVDQLNGQSRGDQLRFWKGMDAPTQAAYTAAGYKPPAADRGIFGTLVHDAGVGLKVAGKVFTPALAVLNTAVSLEQRAERDVALTTAQDTGNPEFFKKGINDPSFWESAFTGKMLAPSSIADLATNWGKVKYGEKVFDPYQDRQIQKQYGDATAGLAKQIASVPKANMAQNIDRIAKSLNNDPSQTNADGYTQAQAFMARVQTDKGLQDAINQYQAAKYTPGAEIVGSDFLLKHPLAGQILSGGIDASLDWMGDPTSAALAAGTAAADARWLVRTPADLDALYDKSSAFRGLVGNAAKIIHAAPSPEQAAAHLARQYPALAPVAGELVKRQADTGPKVVSYLKDQAAFGQVMLGRAARTGTEPGAYVAPHLTLTNRLTGAVQAPLGAAATKLAATPVVGTAAKALEHPIDFLADSRSRVAAGGGSIPNPVPLLDNHPAFNAAFHPLMTGETAVGKTTKALLTMDPSLSRAAEGGFDANSPQALQIIRAYASPFMSTDQVDQLVGTYALAEGTAKQKEIWQGIVDSVGNAAGVNMTDKGAAWWKGVMNDLRSGANRQKYSFGDNDAWMDGEAKQTAGLYHADMADKFFMPSFSELFANSKKMSVTRTLMGAVDNQMVDHLMQGWRTLTLLPNLGFATRMVISEALSSAVREGIAPLVKARLALSTVPEDAGPIARLLGQITDHIPTADLLKARTPDDISALLMAHNTFSALRDVPGRAPLEEYQQVASALGKNGKTDSILTDHLSATHGTAGIVDDGNQTVVQSLKNGKMVKGMVVPTGDFGMAQPGTKLFHYRWKGRLDRIANDSWARVAMANVGAPDEQRVGEVADALQADPAWHRQAVRSLGTADGQRIKAPAGALGDAAQSAGQVTERQAALDHAQRIVADVDHMTQTPDGTPLQAGAETLAQYMLRARHAPTTAALAEVPYEQLPGDVPAPEYMFKDMNWFQHLSQFGFNTLVGRPLNWIVREPLYLHNAVLANRDIRSEGGIAQQMLDRYGSTPALEGMVTDLIHQRAVDRTIPFIHDPGLRSQFSVITRNLMPFWYAKEQAYKRWARTFVTNPAAIRSMMFANQAWQHSGLVHTDAQGNQTFAYPGTAFADKTLNAWAGTLTGTNFDLPITSAMTGNPNFANPVKDGIAPSFGPLVNMPVTALVNRFPELTPVKQAMMPGTNAGGVQYLQEVMPSSLSRVIDAINPNMINHAQYNSAWMQTLQDWMNTGQAFPIDPTTGQPDTSPENVQKLMEQTRDFTRTRILLRSIIGLSGPSAPSFGLDDMDKNFADLMATVGPAEAIAQWQKMHPDATAQTVFQSKSTSGAPLPSTADAMNWMNEHQDLIKKYPSAAAYLMPSAPAAYDANAYQEQLATGLRVRKTPQQFLDDVLFAQGAKDYYASEDIKNQAIASSHSAQYHAQVNAAWADWSAQFMAAHPVFQKIQLGGADGMPPATLTRQKIQSQLSDVLNNDPKMSTNPAYDNLRSLVNGWDTFVTTKATMAQPKAATIAQRQQYEKDMADRVQTFVHLHPETQDYYLRVIRPQLSATALAAANAQTVAAA